MTLCLPKAAVISPAVAKNSSPPPNNSFWGVQFLMWLGFAFCHVENLHFEDIFGMLSAVHFHKQIDFSGLSDSSKGCFT